MEQRRSLEDRRPGWGCDLDDQKSERRACTSRMSKVHLAAHWPWHFMRRSDEGFVGTGADWGSKRGPGLDGIVRAVDRSRDAFRLEI